MSSSLVIVLRLSEVESLKELLTITAETVRRHKGWLKTEISESRKTGGLCYGTAYIIIQIKWCFMRPF